MSKSARHTAADFHLARHFNRTVQTEAILLDRRLLWGGEEAFDHFQAMLISFQLANCDTSAPVFGQQSSLATTSLRLLYLPIFPMFE